MTSITAAQHTALLVAVDALAEKYAAAIARRDLPSTEHLFKQYIVIRDLLDHATIEAGDAQTPDAPSLWRDSERKGWMREGSIYLELVDAPYMTVAINPAGIESCALLVVIEDADEVVAVEPEHLPALIAMLQEVQRRIGGDAL